MTKKAGGGYRITDAHVSYKKQFKSVTLFISTDKKSSNCWGKMVFCEIRSEYKDTRAEIMMAVLVLVTYM